MYCLLYRNNYWSCLSVSWEKVQQSASVHLQADEEPYEGGLQDHNTRPWQHHEHHQTGGVKHFNKHWLQLYNTDTKTLPQYDSRYWGKIGMDKLWQWKYIYVICTIIYLIFFVNCLSSICPQNHCTGTSHLHRYLPHPAPCQPLYQTFQTYITFTLTHILHLFIAHLLPHVGQHESQLCPANPTLTMAMPIPFDHL